MSHVTQRILRELEFLSGEQGSQHQLGHVFGQRRDRREYQRRWSTEKNRHRQRLIETLSLVIMKPAAFLNLPVQPGGVRVVDLHPIDTGIMLFGLGMFSVDERQGD